MKIAFWGSSLVSAYWNGAATYYRGILRDLAKLENKITFFEPDAYDRQKHRDIADPEWACIVVYGAENQSEVNRYLSASEQFDVVVKASGWGAGANFCEEGSRALCVCRGFLRTLLQRWLNGDLFHQALSRFDLVLTYGGGARESRMDIADLARVNASRSTMPSIPTPLSRCTRSAIRMRSSFSRESITGSRRASG